MRSVHFWRIVTCLEISVRERQLQLLRERGKTDKTFRNNCRVFN